MSTQIAIIGNVGQEPDLSYTTSGQAVANLTVAVANRKYNKETSQWEDDHTDWYRINIWGKTAENVAASIEKGMRVIVQGSFTSREWEDKEGNKRTSWEITADAIGPDLKYATAAVTRTPRDGQNTTHAPAANDPWASPAPRATKPRTQARKAPAPAQSTPRDYFTQPAGQDALDENPPF